MVLYRFLFIPLLLLLLLPDLAFSAPYGAKWYDVSEYLLGTVYVKVFFLESNEQSPDTEDWTEQEKAYCRSDLERSLAQIRKRFVREFETEEGSGTLPPGVNLDFVVDYETAEVSVEPIKLNGSGIRFSTGDLGIWVNEVMAEKGFQNKTPPRGPQPVLPYPPYQYNVAEYADYLRNTHNADWATVIFFYDNSDDEDGEFANGRSAGPPMGVGGPGLHFSNKQGRPRTSDEIQGMVHEFLHVWYAIDEHPANKHFREDAVIGYLGGRNENYLRAKGIKCIMYGLNWPKICKWTRSHIGWTDSDGDQIPDILDVEPVVTLAPDPEQGVNIYRGRAFSPPLPNRNPYSEGGTIKPPHDLSVVLHLLPTPERRLGWTKLFKKVPAFRPPFAWTRNDITLNKIIAVEYRLMKGSRALTDWRNAGPADGAFDYADEDFILAFDSIEPGKYTVEVRARNSVHLYSKTLRKALEIRQ